MERTRKVIESMRCSGTPEGLALAEFYDQLGTTAQVYARSCEEMLGWILSLQFAADADEGADQ